MNYWIQTAFRCVFMAFLIVWTDDVNALKLYAALGFLTTEATVYLCRLYRETITELKEKGPEDE